MKILKNRIAVLAMIFLLSLGCIAQNSISGTISAYKNGEGLLTSFDMITGDNIVLGNINKEGKFTIPLDDNYLTAIKDKAKIAQENAPNNRQIQFRTVATTFGCDFDNQNIEYMDDGTEKITYTGSTKKNETVYENEETIIIGIPDPNFTNKDGTTSVMYAVNQPEIAQWLFSYGQNNVVKGYYLQWYFAENAATSNGACVVPTYTGNGEENYNKLTITNLELQKGWNIVKYNITEVFTDVNGNTTPSKIEVTAIDEIPEDVLWTTIIIE